MLTNVESKSSVKLLEEMQSTAQAKKSSNRVERSRNNVSSFVNVLNEANKNLLKESSSIRGKSVSEKMMDMSIARALVGIQALSPFAPYLFGSAQRDIEQTINILFFYMSKEMRKANKRVLQVAKLRKIKTGEKVEGIIKCNTRKKKNDTDENDEN